MDYVRLDPNEPAPADLFDHLGDDDLGDDESRFAPDGYEGFVESEE